MIKTVLFLFGVTTCTFCEVVLGVHTLAKTVVPFTSFRAGMILLRTYTAVSDVTRAEGATIVCADVKVIRSAAARTAAVPNWTGARNV